MTTFQNFLLALWPKLINSKMLLPCGPGSAELAGPKSKTPPKSLVSSGDLSPASNHKPQPPAVLITAVLINIKQRSNSLAREGGRAQKNQIKQTTPQQTRLVLDVGLIGGCSRRSPAFVATEKILVFYHKN